MVQDFTSRPMTGLTPEEIEHRPFSPVKKGGVDEASVRAFLREVAAFVEQQEAQARAREDAFERQISELRNRAENPDVPSGQKLVELVGEEVARTLRTAQESSDEMRRKAEERALRIVRDAQDEAHRVRDEQLEAANQSGRSIVEAARERGREMVGEARSLRERVLADLNRRREALQEQLQELRGGREELASAYRALKQVYDESAIAFARFESNRPFDAIAIDVPPPPLLPPERSDPPELRADPRVASRADARDETREESREDTRAGALEIGELPRADVVEAALVDVPETEAETEAAAPRPAAPEPVATSEPPPAPVPEPEPEPAPAPEPRRRPEPAAATPAPRPAPRPAPQPAPGVDPESGPSTPDLDEIFKRIRAGRIGDDPRPPGPSARAAAPTPEPPPRVTTTATATLPDAGPATRTLTLTVPELERAPLVEPEPEAEAEPGGADAAALQARDQILDAVGVDLTRAAKRALQDEQNELLDALRRQRRGVSLEKVLPPLVDQVATWSDVLSPTLDRVYIEARAHTTGEAPAASTAPRRLVATMAELLVTPMRERITAAIAESPDPDPDAIAQRIGARYREWKGQELEARVGDLLAATYARGVYDAVPEGVRLRWVPAYQGRCSDCDDNALEPTVRGERFPTGQPFPPAHPGCRCSLEVMP